jgi:hypothetical protein
MRTDTDGDGIEDGVDGLGLGGDQGTIASTNFTDAPGGVTSGTITDSGGAFVTVTDVSDPAGVRITVAGLGGPAIINACDVTLEMPSGTDITVTCGSARVQVMSGPINVLFASIEVGVPTGTTINVDEVSPGTFDVSNEPGSSSSIYVGGVTLAPGDVVTGATNVDGDGWISTVDNCPTVATVWMVPPGDGDCDAFTDTDEGLIGTDPNLFCGPGGWPADFDDNQVINILDVGEVLPPYFGTSVPPTSPRRDLVVDGFINILDVGMTLPPYFGYVCTP